MNQMIRCLVLLAALATPSSFAQQTCFTNEVDAPLPPENMHSNLYRGQQAFTVSMLQAIQKATPHENIFFSPYSTYHALLLAYFGARNHTEKELIESLRLQWAPSKHQVNHDYRLEKQQRYLRSKKMPLEFASADKIIFDKTIKVEDCMANIFIDEIETMDFLHESEKARRNINSWIANITHDEIPEMLSPADVSPETQLVLANAAYFKGQWASQFDPKDTKMEIFYTARGKQSFVQMMHKRGTYDLTIDERLGAYVLQMPYLTDKDAKKESEISMVIFLTPVKNNSLEELLSKLTPDTLEMTFKDSMAREIDISLPRFDFEQNLELVPILRSMGINSIFDHDADLSGFSTESNLVFGDAKHVAKIKVDEEGSTASAATVLFSFRSARPLEPTEFKCDHPFLFLIYDHTAQAVLFTGIYRDPRTEK